MEEPNVIVQHLQQLMGAYGYNLYNETARARADDQLVRQKVSGSLGEAANRLAEMAGQYHRDCLPTPSREQPFPPAELMRPMRQMQALQTRLSTLSSHVRGLSAPTEDKTWARFRSEKDVLHRLLQFDLDLINRAEGVLTTARAIVPQEWTEHAHQELGGELDGLDSLLRDRQSFIVKV